MLCRRAPSMVDSPTLPNILTRRVTIIYDMSVPVVKEVIGVAVERQREEIQMIFCYKTLDPRDKNIALKL